MKGILRTLLDKNKIKKFSSVGRHFRFDSLKNVYGPKNITIGENVFLGRNIYIDAIQPVFLGNNVMIGPNVTIISGSHHYDGSNLQSLPFDNKMKRGSVIIEDNVWVCANVCICDNIRIGEGAVVGMGSVVVKDIPPFTIVAGNPAKPIKCRNIDVYNKLKNQKKNYYELFRGKGFIFEDLVDDYDR